MFSAQATLIWDGTAYSGAADIRAFFTSVLPISKHEVLSLDVQPVMPAANGANSALLVTIAGDAKFGMKEQSYGFVHTFLLSPDSASRPTEPNAYAIVHAICRTHKSTLKSTPANTRR